MDSVKKIWMINNQVHNQKSINFDSSNTRMTQDFKSYKINDEYALIWERRSNKRSLPTDDVLFETRNI